MIALKTNDIKNDFKTVSDLVMSGEKVLISRPHNKNLVILSETEYNELEKLRNNAKYLEKLDKSFKQFADGHVVTKTIEELEEMAKWV